MQTVSDHRSALFEMCPSNARRLGNNCINFNLLCICHRAGERSSLFFGIAFILFEVTVTGVSRALSWFC